jgi:hypothetical protein
MSGWFPAESQKMVGIGGSLMQGIARPLFGRPFVLQVLVVPSESVWMRLAPRAVPPARDATDAPVVLEP